MAKEKISNYGREAIETSEKQWEARSKEYNAQWVDNIGISQEEFLIMWDALKEVEKKYNINPWGIAKDYRYKEFYAVGQARAKNYKEHGLKELHVAHLGLYAGCCDYEYEEFNEEVYSLWCRACPCLHHWRNLGRSDEEVKELAPYFCTFDYAIMDGFNPELDNYPQQKLIMKGDERCTYRTEDRRKKKFVQK
jgi:hypothetical protein